MKVKSSKINYSDGIYTHLYDIFTNAGQQVSIISLGASIQKIAIKDNGLYNPVTLGFNSLLPYEARSIYSGVTLAPNAGRIKNAHIPVDGQDIFLAANDGPNQLHGGANNLSAVNWDLLELTEDMESVTLRFCASLKDGVDGFPGNRTFFTTYKISDTGWITIEYQATSDKATYINMSNHTYWNLSGDFSKKATSQTLSINATTVCINADDHTPMDIVPVAGTPFDFRKPVKLSTRLKGALSLDAGDPLAHQIEFSKGYNHAFLLKKTTNHRIHRKIKSADQLKLACTLTDSASKRTLEVFTDAMALVLYSGGFLPEDLQVYDGALCHPDCAIALEAQDVPDVMHFLPEYYKLTSPDEPFKRTIQFHII